MRILNVTLARLPLEEIDIYKTTQDEWENLMSQVQLASNISEALNDPHLMESVSRRLQEAKGIRQQLANIRADGYDHGGLIPYEPGTMAYSAYDKGASVRPAPQQAAGKPL